MSGVNAKGLVCAVLSAFAYCAMVLFNKLSKEVKGIENATFQLLSATAVIAAYTALSGGLIVSVPKSSLIFVVLLGAVNTGIGCFLYFSSASRLPAQSVAVCGYLEPLSAVLFSALILGERLFPLQILGAALIIGGALFGEITKKAT
ncbi:MAG: DMT family transporter [Clostridia bacterium]|nr:DMT family transporter [Clostridia bacterium]